MMRRLHRLMITLAASSALIIAPMMAGNPVTAAAGCDPVATDASTVAVSPTPIAAAGSLAADSSTAVAVTARNSVGNCVAGATVYLYFYGTGSGSVTTPSGSATTTTVSCPGGQLTPNWLACVTNEQGDVAIVYTTPSTLPNGETDTIEATLQNGTSPTVVSTSYTYGFLQVIGATLQAQEGQMFSGRVATLGETGIPDLSTFAATIEWGDGSTSPGNIVATSSGLEVSGTHIYAEESGSAFATRITVSGPSGPTASGEGAAVVADAPLTASGTSLDGHAGRMLNDVVSATFSDGDPAGTTTDYRATIYWGDGTSSPGTVAVDSGGAFGVVGSHTYSGRGGYTVTTVIVDAGGAQAQAVGSAQIIGRR